MNKTVAGGGTAAAAAIALPFASPYLPPELNSIAQQAMNEVPVYSVYNQAINESGNIQQGHTLPANFEVQSSPNSHKTPDQCKDNESRSFSPLASTCK